MKAAMSSAASSDVPFEKNDQHKDEILVWLEQATDNLFTKLRIREAHSDRLINEKYIRVCVPRFWKVRSTIATIRYPARTLERRMSCVEILGEVVGRYRAP